jgi:thymidylate synthase (FAD)
LSFQERLYQRALNMGVPKELARIHLPVGRYSRMRASANLRNWLGFLTLRVASGAQWEIRQYADAVGTLIKQAFPRTWELFAEGK